MNQRFEPKSSERYPCQRQFIHCTSHATCPGIEADENCLVSIDRLDVSIDRLDVSIDRLDVSIDRLDVSIDRLDVSIDRLDAVRE
jgi:hypothetical protein